MARASFLFRSEVLGRVEKVSDKFFSREFFTLKIIFCFLKAGIVTFLPT
jgi:hypothetical protein